ncbi:MAG: terminase TerL endonuclease subunit [bacterium]
MVTAVRSAINKAAAERAVRFIEALRQTKGQWAGQRLKLMEWQKRDIIVPLFGTLNADGMRQYRTCYVELPRKNGKSTLAAGVANLLAFADGEMGAEVYSAASDRDQASLVFNEAASMVKQSPALSRHMKVIESQKRIINYTTSSFYRAISAEAYSKHGFNAHAVIYDELHAAADRELWDVLRTSMGARRQPLMFVITTAGVDRNSICWEMHDYALKVLSGVVEDPTFLPVIYAAPDDADWKDEKVWAAANPALGEFRALDEIRMLAHQAAETPAFEMTFRRLYLNQWVNSYERWMPLDKWDACGGLVDMDSLKGRPGYAGLDLSATTDLTALGIDFPREDSTHDILVHFWIPADTMREKERKDRVPYSEWVRQGYITATPGNVIDYKSIMQYLVEARERFDIREVAFDRWGATKLSQDLIDAGFVMVPFGQGFASMSAPTKELMTLVLGGKVRHGGNPVLRWNVDNIVVNQDPAGNLKPDKARSTQRIDGVVALIMALDRATRHAGELGPSVYESRGVITI